MTTHRQLACSEGPIIRQIKAGHAARRFHEVAKCDLASAILREAGQWIAVVRLRASFALVHFELHCGRLCRLILETKDRLEVCIAEVAATKQKGAETRQARREERQAFEWRASLVLRLHNRLTTHAVEASVRPRSSATASAFFEAQMKYEEPDSNPRSPTRISTRGVRDFIVK